MNKLKRKESNFLLSSDNFLVKKKNFNKQYNNFYTCRMIKMKEILTQKSIHKWGTNVKILEKIIEVEDDIWKETPCVIIGMIFKTISSHPNVTDDYNYLTAAGTTSSFSTSTSLPSSDGLYHTIIDKKKNLSSIHDNLVLEDLSGRIILSGVINVIKNELVTGVSAAFYGQMNNNGEFIVSDYTFLNDTKILEENESKMNEKTIETFLENKDHKYIALVSGVLLSDSSSHFDSSVDDLSFQLLTDFITGKLGEDSASELASRITQVIFAGDSTIPPTSESLSSIHSSTKYTKNSSPFVVSSLSSLNNFDVYLSQILTSCPVSILPGMNDVATNINLPQQPFHQCCFPNASRFSSFSRLTNPCQLSLDNVKILGHSGQSIDDIARQTFPITSNYKNKLVLKAEEMINSKNSDDSEPYVDILITGAHISNEDEGEVDHNVIMMEGEAIEVIKTETEKKNNEDESIEENDPEILKNFRLQIIQNILSWGHLAPTAPGKHNLLLFIIYFFNFLLFSIFFRYSSMFSI